MARATATTDHETIRRWVEAHGGCPAHVKGSGTGDDPGILRIDYPGYSGGASLEKISWDSFFDAFDANRLAFLYTDDKRSRFSKLVRRNGTSRGNGHTRGNGTTRRVAARSKGRARRTGRATKGQEINALDLLSQQHRDVEALFKEMKSARTVAQKRRIFSNLSRALAAHTRIEETIFYPAVFGDETEEILRESVEEHLVAKRLLADLQGMEPSDPQFMGKIAVLKEVVRHHVEEEEQELFKRVRKGDEDLEVLGACLEKRFAELMKDQPERALPKEIRSAVAQF